MKKQVHIFFSGRVQGVGFRFTTQRFALKYKIKGWVRNCHDGKVELLAQANADKLGLFLICLRESFEGYIMDEEIQWQDADSSLKDFSVRY